MTVPENIQRLIMEKRHEYMYHRRGDEPQLLILSEYAYRLLVMSVPFQKDSLYTDLAMFEGMEIVRLEEPNRSYNPEVEIRFGKSSQGRLQPRQPGYEEPIRYTGKPFSSLTSEDE
jgi:hypothetical protein